MVAMDTNIAVRLPVNDDPAQTEKVVQLFNSNEVFGIPTRKGKID